jgi:hypothetical protein
MGGCEISKIDDSAGQRSLTHGVLQVGRRATRLNAATREPKLLRKFLIFPALHVQKITCK